MCSPPFALSFARPREHLLGPFGRFALLLGQHIAPYGLAIERFDGLTPRYCRTLAAGRAAFISWGNITRLAQTQPHGLTPAVGSAVGLGQLTRRAGVQTLLMMIVLEEHAEEPRQCYNDQPGYHL